MIGTALIALIKEHLKTKGLQQKGKSAVQVADALEKAQKEGDWTEKYRNADFSDPKVVSAMFKELNLNKEQAKMLMANEHPEGVYEAPEPSTMAETISNKLKGKEYQDKGLNLGITQDIPNASRGVLKNTISKGLSEMIKKEALKKGGW
jgi:hypothetical protein